MHSAYFYIEITASQIISNKGYKSTCLTRGHVDCGTFNIVNSTLSLDLFVDHNLFKSSHRAIQEK